MSLPDAAAVWCLLGKLYQDHGSVKQSVDCYAESLKLNPFMWDAFEGLCDAGTVAARSPDETLMLILLGANIRVSQIYKLSPELRSLLPAPRLSEKSVNTAAVAVHEDPRHGSPETARSESAPPDDDPFMAAPKGRPPNAAALRLFQGRLNDTANSKSGAPKRQAVTPQDIATLVEMEGDLAKEDLEASSTIATVGDPARMPARKGRNRFGLGQSETQQPFIPVKPRPDSRLRTRTASEDEKPQLWGRPAMQPQMERKRTNTGIPASSLQPTIANDPNAAPQRRSNRIIERTNPISSKFSSLSNSLGLRDNRDRKKVPAVGVKTKTGSVVPGPRSADSVTDTLECMDLDVENNAPMGHVETLTNGPLRSNEQSKHEEALSWLLGLIEIFANGHFALSHYQCEAAVRTFQSLPANQQETPFVLMQIGKAYFESANYAEAEKLFARLRKLAPSQCEGMEYYSTVLWQQKKSVELAFLAHELSDLDRSSPQVWCVIGNSFSLEQDRDQALKCFHRATQLDPKFPYAFTLQGHEYVATEEFDKAAVSYRSAISAGHRHYNAWYGLGKVNAKLGRYEAAVHEFKIAAGINRNNAVLVCAIGSVSSLLTRRLAAPSSSPFAITDNCDVQALQKLKHYHEALQAYSKACELDPRSGMAHFRRAQLLVHTGRVDDALRALILLRDMTPDEANVHYLLGKVYKAVGEKSLAIKHFTTALHLDPKVSLSSSSLPRRLGRWLGLKKSEREREREREGLTR